MKDGKIKQYGRSSFPEHKLSWMLNIRWVTWEFQSCVNLYFHVSNKGEQCVVLSPVANAQLGKIKFNTVENNKYLKISPYMPPYWSIGMARKHPSNLDTLKRVQHSRYLLAQWHGNPFILKAPPGRCVCIKTCLAWNLSVGVMKNHNYMKKKYYFAVLIIRWMLPWVSRATMQ